MQTECRPTGMISPGASSSSSPWPPARWWPTSTTRSPCCTRSPAPSTPGPGPTSTIITATQIGYAAGLLLVVPLGDLHPRRGLVTRLFCLSALALVGCALAPNLWVFAVASVLVGGASVAGQVMIPFAADLAPEERRGRVVARIMTGLLLGILLARTVSGLVAQAAGWRAIYWLSAALMVVFAVVLWRALPAEGPRPHRSYAELVGSSLRLLVTEPVLRRRAWHGACAFAAFSVLWTSLAFLLSGEPVPLLQRGHRALRTGRRRRDRGGQPRRQAGRLGPGHRHHRRLRRPAGRLVRALVGRPHLAGRPHHRDRRARHGDPGHADHQPGDDLRAAPRRPEPHQQRLHGLLLPRGRHRLPARRGASTARTAGPASACSAPASASSRSPCRRTTACGRPRPLSPRRSPARCRPDRGRRTSPARRASAARRRYRRRRTAVRCGWRPRRLS